MAKKLTAAFVRTIDAVGKYGDEHGLILRVLASGAKQWIWRGTVRGRRRDLGLGGYRYVSLAEARQMAFEYRKLARQGGDPSALQSRRTVPTFAEAAEQVIEIHAAGWRDGGKSEKQWRASLATYAYPTLSHVRVDAVTTADVMSVLLAIWNTKRATARRVRQRISTVMRWAVAEGYRTDNPAGDAIAAALPRNGARRQHQRALPHTDVAAALGAVRASDAYPSTKLAFEYLVLTACRSGEVRGARWDEINVDTATWTVPAERMKANLAHRVPLTARALEVLAAARQLADGSGLVFASPTGRILSDGTLSKLLKELGVAAVPHGFRSSFRDWAAECTDAAREVCELALAHVNSDRVEAAYRRTDLFERRRQLMANWSDFLHHSHR